MKLRHKETQEEFESDAIGCSTECVIDKHGERRVFRRSALEPVHPEPQWVDEKLENVCALKQHCKDLKKALSMLEIALSGLEQPPHRVTEEYR